MENGPCEDVVPIENGDIPASYVSLPEGVIQYILPSYIPGLYCNLCFSILRIPIENASKKYLEMFPIITTWMSQEVSKRLVRGLEPQYTPFISRLQLITHLPTLYQLLGTSKYPIS